MLNTFDGQSLEEEEHVFSRSVFSSCLQDPTMPDCSTSGGDLEDAFMLRDFPHPRHVCVVFPFYSPPCVSNSSHCNKVRPIVIFITLNLSRICRVKVSSVVAREPVKPLCCLGRGSSEGSRFTLIPKISFPDFWYVCCHAVLVLLMWSCGTMSTMGHWTG